MEQKKLNIQNKKARFQYELLDKYVAGIQLTGAEIKSIRRGKASIVEAYCFFKGDELFIKNMHIAEYENAGYIQQDSRRTKKLLLNRQELDKLNKSRQTKGLTIVPLRMFINNNGWAKLEVALAKGKKLHDKRDSLKQSDTKREMDRAMKQY